VLDEKRFSQTWNAAQQAVADGEKRRQDFLDRYPLPMTTRPGSLRSRPRKSCGIFNTGGGVR